MSDAWLGGIFLKHEGGYEIVLRVLDHYMRRLSTIGQSPELSDSPMFVQIVGQEAAKTKPQIESLILLIKEGLNNPELLHKVESEVPLIEKAIQCYQSDIQKALENKHEYYVKLVKDLAKGKQDLDLLPNVSKKIRLHLDYAQN